MHLLPRSYAQPPSSPKAEAAQGEQVVGKKEGKPEFLWYKDEQIYNQGRNHMRWSYLSELISKG